MRQHVTVEAQTARSSRHSPQTYPELDAGLTLLSVPSPQSTALHQFAVTQLTATTGPALWVDARNNASTLALTDVAPRRQALANLKIARAFTAYQHHTLIRELARRVTADTALVVVPCVASLYQDGDVSGREGRDLLDASLDVLADLAASKDVPVLVTDSEADATATDAISSRADREIECVRTDLGYRYVGDDFETTVYWHDGFWQTTIPYWVELFGAVAEEDLLGVEPMPGVALEA